MFGHRQYPPTRTFIGEIKMKFKYIKGTEKDFEGAPEWVTHKISGGHPDFYGLIGKHLFYAEYHSFFEYHSFLEEKSEHNAIESEHNDIESVLESGNYSIIAQREPITESQSWYEKGEFPPVGEEVFLVSNKKPECYFGKIIAFNGDEVWIDKVGIKNYKEYSFQPLKTKEQKEKEELRDDLSFIAANSVGRLNESDAAQKLYDMGWRKVEGEKK
jgi:hypothetical protein